MRSFRNAAVAWAGVIGAASTTTITMAFSFSPLAASIQSAARGRPLYSETMPASSSNSVAGGHESSSSSSTDADDGGYSWGVADNWQAKWDGDQHAMEASDVYHQDPLSRMALEMEQQQQQGNGGAWEKESEEDKWLHAAVDQILLQDDEKAVLSEIPLDQRKYEDDYDDKMTTTTSSSTSNGLRVEKFMDEMGQEIAMLVRCNQAPHEMLIEQGRALAPLTAAARHDVSQLVKYIKTDETENDATWQPTQFLRRAIQEVFHRHARQMAEGTTSSSKDIDDDSDSNGQLWIMDERGVSEWIEQCTQEPCARFDPRVRKTISTYGVYGKGYLRDEDLLRLYMETLLGDGKKQAYDNADMQRLLARRTVEREAVWRDLENHGFAPPVEQEQNRQLQEIQQRHGLDDSPSAKNTNQQAFMDECEIVDESLESWLQDAKGQWQRKGTSSHEHVEMVQALDDNGDEANKKAVPLRMKDGEFVFIDEESCIGCTQCAVAAPASFHMLEDGRARTFKQRVAPDIAMAVAACPVSCMHYVGYERLKELELARDSPQGDGRTDHRHFGKNKNGGWYSHIPIHVARRESSENKKDSIYHFTRNQCYKSNACPQRGCYDCPMHASNPEGNPFLQKRRQDAAHIRAQHFIANGEADPFRKETEL
jgi:ferredoxin